MIVLEMLKIDANDKNLQGLVEMQKIADFGHALANDTCVQESAHSILSDQIGWIIENDRE